MAARCPPAPEKLLPPRGLDLGRKNRDPGRGCGDIGEGRGSRQVDREGGGVGVWRWKSNEEEESVRKGRRAIEKEAG